jgi:hypothetical protein
MWRNALDEQPFAPVETWFRPAGQMQVLSTTPGGRRRFSSCPFGDVSQLESEP